MARLLWLGACLAPLAVIGVRFEEWQQIHALADLSRHDVENTMKANVLPNMESKPAINMHPDLSPTASELAVELLNSLKGMGTDFEGLHTKMKDWLMAKIEESVQQPPAAFWSFFDEYFQAAEQDKENASMLEKTGRDLWDKYGNDIVAGTEGGEENSDIDTVLTAVREAEPEKRLDVLLDWLEKLMKNFPGSAGASFLQRTSGRGWTIIVNLTIVATILILSHGTATPIVAAGVR